MTSVLCCMVVVWSSPVGLCRTWAGLMWGLFKALLVTYHG